MTEKLTKAQRNIITQMNNGWLLIRTSIETPAYALQKNGHTKTVNKKTILTLDKHQAFQRTTNPPNTLSTYTLTPKYRTQNHCNHLNTKCQHANTQGNCTQDYCNRY